MNTVAEAAITRAHNLIAQAAFYYAEQDLQRAAELIDQAIDAASAVTVEQIEAHPLWSGAA